MQCYSSRHTWRVRMISTATERETVVEAARHLWRHASRLLQDSPLITGLRARYTCRRKWL